MEIDKKLHDEIKEYCKINGLKITSFINELLRKAFVIEKFGECPPVLQVKQKEETIEVSQKKINEAINHIAQQEVRNIDNMVKSMEQWKTFEKPAEIKNNVVWDDSHLEKPQVKIDPKRVTKKRELK